MGIWLVTGIGLVLVGLSWLPGLADASPGDRTASAVATVTNVRPLTAELTDIDYVYRVRGQAHTGTTRVSVYTAAPTCIGSPVPIVYDKDAPGRSEIPDQARPGLRAGLLAAGFTLSLIGPVTVWLSRRRH